MRSRSVRTCSRAVSCRQWCSSMRLRRRLPGALADGLRRERDLQRGARRRDRVPALHAAGGVPRLGGTGRAPLGQSRPDRRLAGRAEPRPECRVSDVEDRPEDPEHSATGTASGFRRLVLLSLDPRKCRRRGSGLAAAPALGRTARGGACRVGRRRRGAGAPRPPTLAEPRRPAHARSAEPAPRHDRLDRHDRRRDRDRPARQGVRRQPVPDPVVVDGADAALRAARRRLRGALLRSGAREPVPLPAARPAARRDHRLQDARRRRRSSAARAGRS